MKAKDSKDSWTWKNLGLALIDARIPDRGPTCSGRGSLRYLLMNGDANALIRVALALRAQERRKKGGRKS